MDTINWDNRLIAIRGARGVGKTTLMLQYLKLHYANDSQSALYTSLDSLYFTQHTLSELAEQFYLKGGYTTAYTVCQARRSTGGNSRCTRPDPVFSVFEC